MICVHLYRGYYIEFDKIWNKIFDKFGIIFDNNNIDSINMDNNIGSLNSLQINCFELPLILRHIINKAKKELNEQSSWIGNIFVSSNNDFARRMQYITSIVEQLRINIGQFWTKMRMLFDDNEYHLNIMKYSQEIVNIYDICMVFNGCKHDNKVCNELYYTCNEFIHILYDYIPLLR